MAGGRPRSFDSETALDRALELFWRQGYEGTGISDLTKAMGINNAPSLYNAFGNKEQLFRRALDRYADGPARYIREAFAEPTARATVEALLHGAADATTHPAHPRGCITVTGALACAPGAEAARDELTGRRAAGEVALRERLRQARSSGELPAGSDPEGLARYFSTIYQGIAVQAAGGATREQLHQIVDTAMAAWPQPTAS
ncbi:transcriptional regulator, TetR family [Streptomyces sp. DvalAA-14]|uniref:TetR/AcrR family transcriptional regulator n=1 Tax=unclassified Streptomyces TaxID=2593676 RepID=UPI00081B46A9|nr:MULTISPECIES: TetR/AcrR family transcriptional regulator [unclassified Streptomyces]MYS24217.1 TetR family transcriptional regulator [Streptomyces sp. SID4948]SCE43752.1 transcriptional regulator, TetR family [Streptomyces sp. DvalAA-14]